MPTTFAFILDFTFDGENVRALEMGDLFRSGVEGLNRLREANEKIHLEEEYVNMLQQRYPHAIYIEDLSIINSIVAANRVKFHDFSNGSTALCNFKDQSLLQKIIYSRAALESEQDYTRPIIISFQGGFIPPMFRSAIAQLQKKQFNTLDLLNYPQGVLADACDDKVVFNRFIAKTGLCPSTLLVDLKNINLDDIERFLTQNPMSHYVIKPTNMSLGRGVEVVDAKQAILFVKTLQDILNYPYRELPRYSENAWNFSIWKDIMTHKQNHFLLLQTCCPSKEVYYEDKAYRPTGRAVVEVIFDDDPSVLPSLNFLGNYWKFPQRPAGPLSTACLLSHVDSGSPVAQIAAEDWQMIEQQLKTHLPSALLDMYSTDFDTLSDHFNETPAHQSYQCLLEIDEASRKKYEQLPFRANPELYFEDFNYGGPGFYEHMPHFKKAICTQVDKQLQEASNPLRPRDVFFKTPGDDLLIPSDPLKFSY